MNAPPNSRRTHVESHYASYTVGGLIAYLLVFTLGLALLSAPGTVLAAGLGAAAAKIGTAVVDRVQTRSETHDPVSRSATRAATE